MRKVRYVVATILLLPLLSLTHDLGATSSGFSSSGGTAEKRQTTPPPRQSSPPAEKPRPPTSRNETRKESTGFAASGSKVSSQEPSQKKVEPTERAEVGATNRALERDAEKKAASMAWEKRNTPSTVTAPSVTSRAQPQKTVPDKNHSSVTTNATSRPAAPAAHTSENEDRRFSQYRRNDDQRHPSYEERVVVVERPVAVYVPSQTHTSSTVRNPVAVESMAGASAVGAAPPLVRSESGTPVAQSADGGGKAFAVILTVLLVIGICFLVYRYLLGRHTKNSQEGQVRSRYSL